MLCGPGRGAAFEVEFSRVTLEARDEPQGFKPGTGRTASISGYVEEHST